MSELTTNEFVHAYIETLAHNPKPMIKSVLNRTRAYWVIAPKAGIGCVNYTSILNDEDGSTNTNTAPSIGVNRNINRITHIAGSFLKFMNLEIPATIIWRFGIWIALLFICSFHIFLKKRYLYLLTFVPVFIYVFTIYIASGWHDYRYGLSVFFIGMFLVAATCLKDFSKE